MNVYAPALFSLKSNWHVSQGTVQFFFLLQLARECLEKKEPDIFEVVTTTMANNGFFAHPENLLLSMVVDSSQAIRRKALGMIEQLRIKDQKRRERGDEEIRKFMIPTNINFKAKSYYTLIGNENFFFSLERQTKMIFFHRLERFSIKSVGKSSYLVWVFRG